MKIRKTFWILSPVVLSLFPGLAAAQRQLVATHDDIPVLIPAGAQVPRWTNNRLAGCEPCAGAPILYTAGRRGSGKQWPLISPAPTLQTYETWAPARTEVSPQRALYSVGIASIKFGVNLVWRIRCSISATTSVR